jgi:hypothetical protein
LVGANTGWRFAASQNSPEKQESEMAEDKATENAKKLAAEGNVARAKQDAQRAEVMKGRPTPTQEENDIAILGGHPELSEDGSGPDPNNFSTRQVEAGKPGAGYQTRAAAPGRAGQRSE